jgi:phosphate transport system substrate-binding protein
MGKPLVGLVAIAAVLTGCGSDDNSMPGVEVGAASVHCDGKKALKASGSSAQANAMTRFIAAYEAACPGRTVNYTSSGSGAGIAEFIGGLTDFGGSDSPLTVGSSELGSATAQRAGARATGEKATERCGGSAVWNLPTVFGPIAVTYNVADVDELTLDGRTLAKIFNGSVTRWNAPEIVALNPGLALPAQKINVLFRSDDSGTTDNFQQYLATASDGGWTLGAGKTFAGGVGEGAKGNEGTSAAIKNTPGSITYNEWSYVKNQGLSVAKIITSAGSAAVELTVDSASKAVAGVQFKGVGSSTGGGHDLQLDTASLYRPTDPGAYPIVLTTYEVVCARYPRSDIAPAVRAFLNVAITTGQRGLEAHGYIPIPERFKERLAAAINSIA